MLGIIYMSSTALSNFRLDHKRIVQSLYAPVDTRFSVQSDVIKLGLAWFDVDTVDNVSDILTKALPLLVLVRHRFNLGLCVTDTEAEDWDWGCRWRIRESASQLTFFWSLVRRWSLCFGVVLLCFMCVVLCLYDIAYQFWQLQECWNLLSRNIDYSFVI